MGAYSEEIHRLMAVVELVRGDDPVMPIQMLQTFLAVAKQPGISMQQLGEILKTSQASCSRNVAALGKWHKFGEPGLDLVEAVEDPVERRRKIMFLTAKGRVRVQEILSAVTGKPVTDFETKDARSLGLTVGELRTEPPSSHWRLSKG
ncbi:MAG: winged helix-turn-helix transcriptional regulator [Hyphomicrobiales bacterium]|nr:winged helix-turn-helix transcriptional regulator [Hyphomicrobiales bacterium]